MLELPTRKGFSYIQVTHLTPEEGPLIAVMPGLFESRPGDMSWVGRASPKFRVLFPVTQAVRRKVMTLIGNYKVSPESAKFPVLRRAGFVDREGVERNWWLWDGTREWSVASLSPEQRCLSSREIWNDTLLVERIESDWRPH